MTSFRLILFLLFINFFSCKSVRQKDPDEIVLHENIQEKEGLYYWGDCESHATTLCTTTDTCYHHGGKTKATYTLKDGLPNGHWQQFDTSGKKTLDLYFNNGLLVKKDSH